jgi:RNA polymerase sigma factor (sigma-70 family)
MQITPIAKLAQERAAFLQFVRRRVDSAATAEDILQNAYIRATEKLSTVRSEESLTAWFYRILRNAIIDHYRHRSVETRAFDRLAQEPTPQSEVHPSDQAAACHCVTTLLSELKPAYNTILREVDMAGSSLESFARTTGITAGNAAVRVHRARQALRRRITEVCGACSKNACTNCTCPQA